MPLEVPVPGSKSITQRALVLAALAESPTEIVGALDCDDSRHLRSALLALGTSPSAGSSGRGPGPGLRIFCGNAGTTIRFAAAFSLLVDGALTLDGDEHMRRRPIADLAEALAALGVGVRWEGAPGFPPLTLQRGGDPGSEVEVDAARSSQFASALLLVAPRLRSGLTVRLRGAAVSRPYLDLTVAALRAFGARVDEAPGVFRVERGPLRCARFEVEGDWSSAAFVLAAGRIAGVEVFLPNVCSDSLQGDRAIIGLLERLSGPSPRAFDLGDCPDLLAPFAAAAAFADGPTEIRNVAHARIKESDRLRVLAEGFCAAGIAVEELPDGLVIGPGPRAGDHRPTTLDPHGDHRMAMAFGLLSLRLPHLRVADPDCVSKSYPGFWRDLELLRGESRTAPSGESGSGGDRPLGRPPAAGRPLFLLGLRGSGKTTVGRLVAERLGLVFVDADEELERRAGETVAEIFAGRGEARFRELERETMLELLARRDVVIATGGGCVLDAGVRELLRRSGAAVWLDAPPAVRAARITGSPRPPLTDRPGLGEEGRIASEREPLYRACAAARVSTEGRTPEEVAGDVERVREDLPGRDVR